jgi:hypothetical protein
MTTNSWVFVKGSTVIRVARRQGRSLVVTAPGTLPKHYQFGDEAAMEAYQIELAENLTDTGWFLSQC